MTMEEAKEFFMSMNCSAFVMAREEQPLYEEYLKLYISTQTETKWRNEKLMEYCDALHNATTERPLWEIYNLMAKLASAIKSYDSMIIMKNAVEEIDSRLDMLGRIITAETIIGRLKISSRSGLIFLAYDMGHKEMARYFSDMAERLLRIESGDADMNKRIESDRRDCLTIKRLLKL
jgi:hypothetical protein